MKRKIDWSQIACSPKSTIVGLCILALSAERGIHFDASGHLQMCARDWFEVGCGAMTAFVSGVTRDAQQERGARQDEAPQ